MEKIKKILMPVIIVLVLLLPMLITYINNRKINVISISDYNEVASNEEVTLTYFGDLSSDNYKKIKDELIDLKIKYKINVSTVDISNLTNEKYNELNLIDENLKDNNTFVITKDGAVAKTIKDTDENISLDEQLDKYINNVIPQSEIAYKTVDSYSKFKSVINSKSVTMHVFGRNTCYYCNIFKPIYNDAAAEYDIDIYYYDSDTFSSDEYKKILNSGLKIPAECTNSHEEEPLSSGFGTPLTLFTKKGKVVGCIGGYVNREKLDAKLKSVGMIK